MYRDDVCAVCGESLPPDHFYCRRHAVDVDDRLHEIASRLPSAGADAAALSTLLRGIAEETWDYLAEQHGDPMWPPQGVVELSLDTEAVEVEVDDEPGMVRVRLETGLPQLLAAMARALASAADDDFIAACATATGANATH